MSQASGATGGLGTEAVAYLARGGTEVVYQPDEVILRRGEPGRAFYVLLAGEAEVRLAGEGGRQLPLTRLAPGSSFGELALLMDEPVSADVVALRPTTVLRVPAEVFVEGLAECEPLRRRLLQRLAQDLQRTTSEAWRFFQRAEALRLLTHDDRRPPQFVASSARLKGVKRRIEEMASDPAPVLIRGAAGTGKLLAARLMHAARQEAGPLIVVDCQRVAGDEAHRLLLGSYAASDGTGALGGLGAIHLAHGGSLVLRHVDALPPDLQQRLADHLAGHNEEQDQGARRVRLAATTRLDVDALQAELAARFEASVLRMPSLAKCPRDVLPLAQHFLAENNGEPLRLSPDARRALVSHGFRQRNVAELEEALELAALCADGPEIRAEHIFSGPKGEGAPPGLAISGLPLVHRLIRRPLVSLVRGVGLAAFAAVILVCLFAAGSRTAQVANAIIWGVWEPVVFALFLLAGRVWCTVCPLSAAGTLAQRLGCLGRPPPGWIKSHGIWLAVAGFFVIVWVERIFHMVSTPQASALLLLGLILAAVLFGVVYEREVWCRYVCPLGTLGASLAPPAPLSIASNPSVCASSCTTHECYKGSAEVPGCTVFHHPLYASEAHACKLCLDCLHSCPHGSAALYLRPPLRSLWRLGGGSATLSVFAVPVMLLSLVLLASQRGGWVAQEMGVTVLGLVALAAGAALGAVLPRLLRRTEEADRAPAAQVGLVLLVLGWGPLMAYQLGNILVLGGLSLTVPPGHALAGLLPAAVPVLSLLRLAVVLLAALLAAISLVRVWRTAAAQHHEVAPGGWHLVVLVCSLYLAAAVVLAV